MPHGLRICVVGDDLVAGMGDGKSLGWVGRVAARTGAPAGGIAVFPLGVPGEGSASLLKRWQQECGLRFAQGSDNRLVVGVGTHDLDTDLSLARSRLNMANILDEAFSRSISSFVVGPPPSGDPDRDEAISALSAAFADVCDRRSVPYVDCYTPLATHDQWHADLAAGDGQHPGQAGYGLMAWLVLHGGWHQWLGIPQE
ncbi:MAG: lysophospholipase [Micrococcales bacterium]|nr:MAG: lysophospholipase [Micrococcales bacterium]PIE26284.1 MAG: lysophospholipase [Micrococcales bacterium]